MNPSRPSFTGSDYHSRRTRRPVVAVQPLVEAGRGQTERAAWVPMWLWPYAVAAIAGVVAAAWVL